jgi:hypothetical protein
MTQTTASKNSALVIEAFDTLFNSATIRRICRLNEGCDVCSFRAAATVRLPASTTATK